MERRRGRGDRCPRVRKTAAGGAAAGGSGLPCTLPVGSQMQEVMMRWGGGGGRGGGGSTRCDRSIGVMASEEADPAGHPPRDGEGRERKRTRSAGNRLDTKPGRSVPEWNRGAQTHGSSVTQRASVPDGIYTSHGALAARSLPCRRQSSPRACESRQSLSAALWSPPPPSVPRRTGVRASVCGLPETPRRES